MEGDVSKRTIMVLVVLTVLISVLGALSVVSAMADLRAQNTVTQKTNQGWVGLHINGAEPEKESAPSVTGRVALEIQQRKILLLPED